MNIYVINVITCHSTCIIGANNENIVKFVFNNEYKNYTNNPIKDWNCIITKLENATVDINTPRILYDSFFMIHSL